MPVTITTRAASREPAPSTFRRYKVSGHAAAAGQVHGLTPDLIAEYARRGARYKDDAGRAATHRFHDYLFNIKDGTVVGFWRLWPH